MGLTHLQLLQASDPDGVMDATRSGTGVDESLLFRKHEALPEAMVNTSRPREHMAAMCTEQCKFKVSCKLCIDGEWPAPICDRWAVSVRDDIYYKKFNGSSSAHETQYSHIIC